MPKGPGNACRGLYVLLPSRRFYCLKRVVGQHHRETRVGPTTSETRPLSIASPTSHLLHPLSLRRVQPSMEDADDARRNAALAASLDRLQFVLLNALDSEYGRQIVEDELLLPGDSAKPGIKPSKNESAPSAKRKRLEHCAQCKLEFDVATNGMDECVWHSGMCLFSRAPL